jgi:LPS O-antigen subunit length determinant protein (WzzB/FepE family)
MEMGMLDNSNYHDNHVPETPSYIAEKMDVLSRGKKEPINEVFFIDIFIVFFRSRLIILGITIAAMIGIVIFSVVSIVMPSEKSFLPNLYTPRANMLINNTDSSGSGIAAAINASGLGSLASIAGVNVRGGPTFSSLAVYLVYSDTMLDSIIEEFDLIVRYKIKEHIIAHSRKALKEKLRAEYDDTNGVFSVSFSDYDPVFARDVIGYCVEYLSKWFETLGLDKNLQQRENLEKNIAAAYEAIRSLEREIQNLELSATMTYTGQAPNITLETRRINMELNAQQQIYAQLKVQLELTNTAIASETPIFQILETAQVPDLKSGPNRGKLCVLVALGAFFFSLLLVFVLTQIEKIKNDPEAMDKFRAVNTKRSKKK